jgi:3-oxoadipate CoA-transferase alpha subunit
MATAAATVIVQVDDVVDLGGIDPETVVTPSIYVDRVLHVATSANRKAS